MTPEQFCEWRKRNHLTIKAAALLLGASFSSVRQYGDGTRTVPNYIEKLCNLSEEKLAMQNSEKDAQKLKGNKKAAHILAAAYIAARRQKNPLMAATMNHETVREDMEAVLAILKAQGVTIGGKKQDNEKAG